MFIADVLRHDAIEQVQNILNMLNNDGCIGWREFWPHDFRADEVCGALTKLAEARMVDACVYDDDEQRDLSVTDLRTFAPDYEDVWFHLNKRGWAAWEAWDDYPTIAE